MVLPAGDCGVRGRVRIGGANDGRTLAAGRIGDCYGAHSERVALAGILPGGAAAADGVLPAATVLASPALGEHGRAACRIPRWANAGEGWAMVSDGADP